MQILQETAGGINPFPALKAHPRASSCMSDSQTTAVHASKAAMLVPHGLVQAAGI